MPNEAIHHSVGASDPWVWCNRILWSVVTFFVVSTMARVFISKEPFDIKRFTGEVLFSVIGAIALYSMGLMQGMNEVQIIGFGAFASLGGVRTIEWAIKIAGRFKDSDLSGVK